MSDVEVSVIIAAHDAEQVLAAQLDALCAQVDAPSFEVLVVANCCRDATVRVAESFADRLPLRTFVADEMLSVAYARNMAADQAVGRHLLLCDADDQVGPTWVAAMVARLDVGDVDFVGGSLEVDRRGLPRWIYDWRYRDSDASSIQGGPLPTVINASLGVRTSTFRAVGGFDERFTRGGFEDLDLSRRLFRAGYRLGEARDATIVYQPRRTLRYALAQGVRNTRNYPLYCALAGTLHPRWSAPEFIYRSARHLARRVVRQRQFHPLLLACDLWVEFMAWRSHAEFDATHPTLPTVPMVTFDFMVPISTPVIGGLALAAEQGWQAEWYAGTGLEPAGLAALDHFLTDGATFVDVGAHIGVYTVAGARCVGTSGRVIAFEPADGCRELLRINCARHRVLDRVEVRHEAVVDTCGSRTFHEYENGLVSGLGEAPLIYSGGSSATTRCVDVVDLDSVVDGAVDVIKIDVEGFEPDVLRGAAQLIARSPRLVLLMEVNPASSAATGHRLDTLFDLLPAEEWDLRLIDNDTDTDVDRWPTFHRRDLCTLASRGPAWYGTLVAIKQPT